LPILNPDHLLEQAEKLIEPPPAGPPRQVDIRRAISAAYYSVFHATLRAAADLYVGVIYRATSRYTLVYRSIDHKDLRDLCSKVRERNLSAKLTQYAPVGGFDTEIMAFAQALLELQEKRLDADYNPSIRVRSSDAQLAIGAARNTLQRLQSADPSNREAFLGLLLFKIR
jgi:hypothetical protein